MKIHQVRNATIVIEANDQYVLVDPMLGRQGSFPPFRYLTTKHRRNPLCDLPAEFSGVDKN